ncbi:hypothetical protein AAG906_036592 [Vitis piasezkii]
MDPFTVDEETEDDEETEGEAEDYIPLEGSTRVSQNGAVTSDQAISVNGGSGEVLALRVSDEGFQEGGGEMRRVEGGEISAMGSSSSSNGGETQEGSDGWVQDQIDGLCCPICMEAWTSGGEHQVCCLPCGHIYGISCIKKWFQQCGRSSGKCPQCKRKCTLRNVRTLYASRVVAVDEDLRKKIRSLEAKCASLEKKNADWCMKESDWHKREADLHLQVQQLIERTTYLERLSSEMHGRGSGLVAARGHNFAENFGRQGSSCNFVLQKELQVDGARYFDIDASGEILVIARRLSGTGGTHVLTKMSLIAPHEIEDILLPSGTKAVKDLRVSPAKCRLALLASLGKKLSVLSMESNNVILTYDLPMAAWSCSWDLNSSHYMYAGLQNGMLMVFDMRQTARPMAEISGPTSNPIHTIHSVLHNSTLPSGVSTLLSASSVGLCQWNFGGSEERPFLVPETKNHGVCISLAHCPSSDDIVSTFRPKVEMSNEIAVSQYSPTPSVMGQGMQGSHVLLKRVGGNCYQKLGSSCANVNDVRLPRSAIIDLQSHHPLFVSGDEITHELVLQELPSLRVSQRLKSQKHPLRDVKYSHDLSPSLLCCLSEDTLQFFSAKFS